MGMKSRMLAQIANSLAMVELSEPDRAFFFFSESHSYLLVPVALHLWVGMWGCLCQLLSGCSYFDFLHEGRQH